ncbi:MAG: hypothetical protein JO209_05630 [Acidisphaera sp.]|nr:hypothetical protein [Acidisphaera sp.]
MSDLSAEERLWEAAHQALRAPKERVALVLRLSRLSPPAPRRHHLLVCRAILEEAAQRYDGEIFLLGNGDALLLCRLPPVQVAADAALTEPSFLPNTFARLFRVDVSDPAALTTLWTLERDGGALLGYAAEVRGQPPSPAAAPA